jgi:hypothetical protein
MPARTIEQSIQFREWVDKALSDGCDSPTQVLEWIEQRKNKGEASPSLPTVSKIMRDRGYKPTGAKWEKSINSKDVRKEKRNDSTI